MITCSEKSDNCYISAEFASDCSASPLDWTCFSTSLKHFFPAHHTYWAVLQQLFMNSATSYIFKSKVTLLWKTVFQS